MKPRIKTLQVSRDHVLAALEGYLKAMTMLDDDYTVVEISGSGGSYSIVAERDTK